MPKSTPSCLIFSRNAPVPTLNIVLFKEIIEDRIGAPGDRILLNKYVYVMNNELVLAQTIIVLAI